MIIIIIIIIIITTIVYTPTQLFYCLPPYSHLLLSTPSSCCANLILWPSLFTMCLSVLISLLSVPLSHLM